MQNKYIGIKPNVFIYHTNAKANIVYQNLNKNETCYTFFSVNETGEKIIGLITGQDTLKRFKHKFCDKYEINYEENRTWIDNFIKALDEKGIVLFSDTAMPNTAIEVVGAKDAISPLSATIEVTEQCNLRCKHCYADASPNKNKKHMPLNDFYKLVDILRANKVFNLELTGGELFVHPNAYEIVQTSLNNFATVGILTNGVSLNDKMLELLKSHKDKIMVNISIDSVNPETHDTFRGLNGAFGKSCETVKRLTSNGIRVRLASTIFNDNLWEVDKLAELTLSLGASVFSFGYVENFGRGVGFRKKTNVDVTSYVKYINDTLSKYKHIMPIIDSKEFLKTSDNCGAGVNSITIGVDGKIRPCVIHPHTTLFGNVFTDEYTTIFEKDIYRKLSKIPAPSIETGCDKTCDNFLICRGCFLKGLEYNKESKYHCNWIIKNELAQILKVYEEEHLYEKCK